MRSAVKYHGSYLGETQFSSVIKLAGAQAYYDLKQQLSFSKKFQGQCCIVHET